MCQECWLGLPVLPLCLCSVEGLGMRLICNWLLLSGYICIHVLENQILESYVINISHSCCFKTMYIYKKENND